MHNLIKEMLHYKNCLDGAEPDRETVARFEQRYDGILNQAKEEYEYEPPTEYYRDKNETELIDDFTTTAVSVSQTEQTDVTGNVPKNSFLHTPVRNLSLGQRIRCEIVASLIHRPRVLFLDEPTIGLDPVVKESIRALIKQMNKELGTTIFLTSHDVGDIEKLCRRIIIVNSGRIVLDQSMEHLKYHYLNKKIVEAKLQEEPMLRAREGITVLKQKGGHVKFEVDTEKMRISEALRLIGGENVEDINISNIPLENIITEIYKAEESANGAVPETWEMPSGTPENEKLW